MDTMTEQQVGSPVTTVAPPGSLVGNGNTNSDTTGITVRDISGGGGTANQTATAGSGAAHNNVQPSMAVKYIIKAPHNPQKTQSSTAQSGTRWITTINPAQAHLPTSRCS